MSDKALPFPGGDLPKNVIPIETLRINRNKHKRCACKHRKFEIDTENREVTCKECGTVVDPYEALLEIACNYEQLGDEVSRLLEQRKQILGYEPHLLAVREIERIYRSRDMLPCCPHCNRGIEAEELTRSAVNKQVEMERRRFENRGDSEFAEKSRLRGKTHGRRG